MTLAVIGFYGVVSYTVSRRAHEIGLRMALGASRVFVFRMIYRQSTMMVEPAWRLAWLAFYAAHAVGSLIVLSAWEPATYVLVAMVLALTALASAICLPGVRWSCN